MSDDGKPNEALINSSAYGGTKKVIDSAAYSWIGPVFFVDLGAKLVFDMQILLQVLPYAVLLTVGLFGVQILSAGLAQVSPAT